MSRKAPFAILVAILLSSRSPAQEWADKMFPVKSYNFGNIARGAKAEYAFEFTNLYLEDVHVADVRVTCGCTTPRIEKDTLKTYEKGAIVAHINSDRFLGHQESTIIVTFDKPFYAQVRLHVKVYIYSDVLLEPAGIVMGSVPQGRPAEATIRVCYTGPHDWRIVKVQSENPHLTGAVVETSRQAGQVIYELKAILDKDAPAGYVREQLWLMTNDPAVDRIPVSVEAQVQPDISASPSSLFLGVVKPGQSVTKQIVVRGQKPFQIHVVRGDCECVRAAVPKVEEPKSLYVVPITFTAPNKAGRITPTIEIETDSGKTVLKVPIFAVVGGQ